MFDGFSTAFQRFHSHTSYIYCLLRFRFRDMVTSSVILLPLLLLSFVNSALRCCLSSFDLHEFLIYRSTGHRARRRAPCGDSERLSSSESVESQTEGSTDEEAPMAPHLR